MRLREQSLKKLIEKYQLQHRKDVSRFIEKNPEDLSINELSRIAELVNNSRVDTAAFYTDPETLEEISKHLPEIAKDVIHVLEPSAGVGNFIQIIIDKYSNAKQLIIDINDIDKESIELAKLLNKKRIIPDNVKINYSVTDFLLNDSKIRYDLVIGNPPFLKLSKKNGLDLYANIFKDYITSNLAGFFIEKSSLIADNIVMILPKYFLNNTDFYEVRNRINQFSINTILDFGERGFKGVLIETIALFVNTRSNIDSTYVLSTTKKLENIVKQSVMTSSDFPTWLLYRNDFFEKIACRMNFGVFKVFRDRQLTNSILRDSGDIRVIKSRNISRDGRSIDDIQGYDAFLNKDEISKYSVSKYLEREDVYLSPNMTYYPRVIKKQKNTLVNGSVAILEKTKDVTIEPKHLEFLSGDVFEEFYRIARNYSTRSLNIDANSVYFFGLYD